MFGNAYIELLGVVDPAKAEGRLVKLLSERGEGGIGIAYGHDDADGALKSLRAAGIDAEEPNALSRPLELDGERHLVRFRNVMLPDAEPKGLLQFVCTHLTPELTRARHEWELHANGAIRLAKVTVSAEDINASSWPALFGEDCAVHGDGEHSFALGNLTLSLATPTKLGEQLRAEQRLPYSPSVAALTFAVHELDLTIALLERAGVAFKERRDEVVVPASAAHGVALIFAES
jgi:hypothetical protein